jgi:hypothetical protein
MGQQKCRKNKSQQK